jgi:hypothetical protein
MVTSVIDCRPPCLISYYSLPRGQSSAKRAVLGHHALLSLIFPPQDLTVHPTRLELIMKLPLSASASATEDEQLQQQEVVTGLLKGDRRFQVISHPGTSQYAQGGGRGISACGLAALNCARCLLAKASQTPAVAPDAFLHNLFARETIDVSR